MANLLHRLERLEGKERLKEIGRAGNSDRLADLIRQRIADLGLLDSPDLIDEAFMQAALNAIKESHNE